MINKRLDSIKTSDKKAEMKKYLLRRLDQKDLPMTEMIREQVRGRSGMS